MNPFGFIAFCIAVAVFGFVPGYLCGRADERAKHAAHAKGGRMKHYQITITTDKGRIQLSGLFSSSFDALDAGFDAAPSPYCRIHVRPA